MKSRSDNKTNIKMVKAEGSSRVVDTVLATTSGSAVGAVAGAVVSGFSGIASVSAVTGSFAAVGSVVPIVGSVIGATAGLIVGSFMLKSKTSKKSDSKKRSKR